MRGECVRQHIFNQAAGVGWSLSDCSFTNMGTGIGNLWHPPAVCRCHHPASKSNSELQAVCSSLDRARKTSFLVRHDFRTGSTFVNRCWAGSARCEVFDLDSNIQFADSRTLPRTSAAGNSNDRLIVQIF